MSVAAPMPELEKDLAAFKELRTELEVRNKGEWAVIHQGVLLGIFPNFEAAATEAVAKFGRGPYLIRQIGSGDFIPPASLMYRLLPEHA